MFEFCSEFSYTHQSYLQRMKSHDDERKLYPFLTKIFTQLPGDDLNFHTMVKSLTELEKFDFSKDVVIYDCVQDRDYPFWGRAFFSVNEKIYLCGNSVWKSIMKNDRKEIQRVLLHELVHLYDKKVRNWNLFIPEDLACSETRAYNLSSNCKGKNDCLTKLVRGSLEKCIATKDMSVFDRELLILEALKKCKNGQNFERFTITTILN